jgi:hypothetical protein
LPAKDVLLRAWAAVIPHRGALEARGIRGLATQAPFGKTRQADAARRALS